MAEAWLKELMRLIVREGGRTALATETIEEVASAKLGGRTGVELSVWLESLFAAGKLVKIHGGDATGCILRQDGLDELEFRRNIAHLAHSGRNVTSKGL